MTVTENPLRCQDKEIDHYFRQHAWTKLQKEHHSRAGKLVDKIQQNDSCFCEMSKNSTKSPKCVTALQSQGPTEQTISLTKTINVTLKGANMGHVVKYSEGESLEKKKKK